MKETAKTTAKTRKAQKKPAGYQPRFSELDQYLFGQATHYDIFRKMGAHLDKKDGKVGAWFTVWAPHAAEVSVIGEFNGWDAHVNVMRKVGEDGVYEVFIPGVTEGMMYKYYIRTPDGRELYKADPYAFASEKRPGTASKVAEIEGYRWGDSEWLTNRKKFDVQKSALSIYEVHPGSWMKHPWSESNPDGFYNYVQFAHSLADYVKKMGYTHVELMGIAEHPDRIMIGIVMLLISGLSTTNGIRDLLQRDFISGFINIMNSFLGAAGIAFGIGLAIILFHEGYSDHFILNHSVPIQLLSCTVACTGFALWFKIRGKQVWYNSIGAFFTWAIYVAVSAVKPSNFMATMIAAGFVGFYAFIMSRVNKAPSTIFLTASVFPLIPGPNLYYVMYGCVSQDPQMVFDETIILLATCLAIAFGFIIVDVASRSIMHAMKREYHIGKSALNLPLIGGKK